MMKRMRELPNDRSAPSVVPLAVVALLFTAASGASWAQDEGAEFDELKVLIEINATDGDAGFHALLDADAWRKVRADDPDGNRIFQEKAKGPLREQGLTENFFESDEPLCSPDEEDPEAEVVPLSEFLERFAAGEYQFGGITLEDEMLSGEATLTYNLPAAPDISGFDESSDVDPDSAVITWAPGSDLGGCQDDDLVADGVIPDPATVPVVGWEVVVEPEDEEAVDPLRVFSAQLPPDQMSVTVPPEFINSYVDDGVTEFKFEVGAIEASGNQTFSEGTFEVEEDE